MGGGVASQVWHLSRAIPSIRVTSDISEVSEICITEALWLFDASGTDLYKKIDEWGNLKAFKILINNDLTLARYPRDAREMAVDSADVVATTSKYAQQMLKAFSDEVHIIYDPIDVDMFIPETKTRTIFSMGQICAQKNIQKLIDIFEGIRDTSIQKGYIGDLNVWGGDSGDHQSKALKRDLMSVCDWIDCDLPRLHIPQKIASMWAYIADSRYDFSSYSMMESMLAGCWTFTGRHLLYDERPGFRFNTTPEAIKLVLNKMEELPPESGKFNEEGRQFIVDRNSYDAFRMSIKLLVGNCALEL